MSEVYENIQASFSDATSNQVGNHVCNGSRVLNLNFFGSVDDLLYVVTIHAAFRKSQKNIQNRFVVVSHLEISPGIHGIDRKLNPLNSQQTSCAFYYRRVIVWLMNPQNFRLGSTTVKNFEACNRKAFFQSILKIPQPENKAFALGTAVHLQLENYLTRGLMPDDSLPGKIAKQGLHLLPAPASPGLNVEHSFSISLGAYAYTGSIDFYTETPLLLGDHKTSSNISRYALSAHELERDVQATAYGRVLMERYNVDSLDARWVYYSKDISGAQSRDFVLHRPLVEERWGRTLESARGVIELAVQMPAWQDVKPNWRECSNFGGCFFKDKCAATRPAAISVPAFVPPKSLRVRLGLGAPKARRDLINPPDASPISYEAGE